MTLVQRPGSRFFAAFYRWNRCTQRTSPCPCPCPRPLQARHLLRHTATSAALLLRSYHTTCCLRREGASTHTHSHSLTQELERSSATDASSIPKIEALLKDDVRNLMRRVPCCVAIATVAHVDSESGENVPMGIAVSSLSTVTLDPPTISFNIKEPSQTLNAIRAAQGSFRVHWLAAKGDSVPIIQQFTQGNNPDAYLLRRQRHVYIPQEQDRSTAAAFSAPRIRADNLIAAAECVLTHQLPVGDHIILVAQIKSLEMGDQSGFAMAYVDGSYRAVANGPEN